MHFFKFFGVTCTLILYLLSTPPKITKPWDTKGIPFLHGKIKTLKYYFGEYYIKCHFSFWNLCNNRVRSALVMPYASDQGDLNRFIEKEKSMAYPVEVFFILQNIKVTVVSPSKWTELSVKNTFLCLLPYSAHSRTYHERIALRVAWQSLKAHSVLSLIWFPHSWLRNSCSSELVVGDTPWQVHINWHHIETLKNEIYRRCLINIS